jgi:hypothetical protein
MHPMDVTALDLVVAHDSCWLKKIRHNSTMERGSAAQELIEELRLYFTLALSVQHISSNNFVYERSDTSLDFIAVYNSSNNFTQSVSLLQRTGADEIVSEESLALVAALEIQSTRASMSIEGILHSVTGIC